MYTHLRRKCKIEHKLYLSFAIKQFSTKQLLGQRIQFGFQFTRYAIGNQRYVHVSESAKRFDDMQRDVKMKKYIGNSMIIHKYAPYYENALRARNSNLRKTIIEFRI